MNSFIEKLKIYGPAKFVKYAISETYNKLWMQVARGSYSQKGEDLVLEKKLGFKKNGFYVDVGANDPVRFSNTKRFYDRGWTGINIEPDRINYEKISKARSKDINLNIGIGLTNSQLEFYRFLPDTLSTFAKEEADEYIKQGYKLEDTLSVEVVPLRDVLEKHCSNREIDFMSVDTEGFDMQVLKSNDWQKFRPKAICIESVSHTMDGKNNTKEDNHEDFLESVEYIKVYDNGLNSIYVDNKSGLKAGSFEAKQKECFDNFSQEDRVEDLYKESVASQYEFSFIRDILEDIGQKVVLDLGCGVGRFGLRLAKEAKEVVGVDISDHSIEKANKIAIENKISNFKGIVSNFSKPVYVNYFDYVIIVNVLHHVDNLDLLLLNVEKSLSKKGKLIIFEFNPFNVLFIPFLIFIRQFKSHFNLAYFRSNIFTLRKIIKRNGFQIEFSKKYAFLPTILYNSSEVFVKINDFLNKIPIVNLFCAFHVLVCAKESDN